jgi:hypothetical protein
LFLKDRDGDEILHLWSVELASGKVRDLTPFSGVRAQSLLTSAGHPHEVLIGLNKRDQRVFDMYRIDLETGACKLDTQNPGDVIGWTPDNDFVLRAAGAFDPTDGKLTVRVRDAAASPWRDLVSIPFGETPILGQTNGGRLVAGFTADGTGLYMVSWRGSDTTRLVRVDAATGREQETLAHDPRCDLWGSWDADRVLRYRILFHPQTGALQAVAFQDMRSTRSSKRISPRSAPRPRQRSSSSTAAIAPTALGSSRRRAATDRHRISSTIAPPAACSTSSTTSRSFAS